MRREGTAWQLAAGVGKDLDLMHQNRSSEWTKVVVGGGAM